MCYFIVTLYLTIGIAIGKDITLKLKYLIPDLEEEINNYLDKFQDYQHRAEVYYAYYTLYRYTEEPFTSHLPEALFNMARFLIHQIAQEIPYGKYYRNNSS